MSSGMKVMQGNFFEVWWQWLPSSSLHIARILVIKIVASANASLRESLVDLESLKSSYKVIQAGMLAS